MCSFKDILDNWTRTSISFVIVTTYCNSSLPNQVFLNGNNMLNQKKHHKIRLDDMKKDDLSDLYLPVPSLLEGGGGRSFMVFTAHNLLSIIMIICLIFYLSLFLQFSLCLFF